MPSPLRSPRSRTRPAGRPRGRQQASPSDTPRSSLPWPPRPSPAGTSGGSPPTPRPPRRRDPLPPPGEKGKVGLLPDDADRAAPLEDPFCPSQHPRHRGPVLQDGAIVELLVLGEGPVAFLGERLRRQAGQDST